jgi:phage gp46-like protein
MIKLAYNAVTQSCDLVRNGKNLIDDPTLATSVIISLFTRRLAAADDALPTPTSTREGWWADPYADVKGDLIGSRLWLLNRAKATQETANLARAYALESLAWMLQDGVAATVDCNVEWHQQAEGSQLLAIQPIITKPSDPTRWSAVWLANLSLL